MLRDPYITHANYQHSQNVVIKSVEYDSYYEYKIIEKNSFKG